MKLWQKRILVILCLLGICFSYIYHYVNDSTIIKDKTADIFINIEIDNNYANYISVIDGRYRDREINLSHQKNDILSVGILSGQITNQITNAILLRIPKEAANETINSLKGISVFIGNKCFYFSVSDISNIQSKEQDNYLFYEFPGLEYNKSLIPKILKRQPFINWYGDFNLIINAVLAIFIYPQKLFFTWLFILCLLFICRKEIGKFYENIISSKTPITEILLLSSIVLIGFALRLNDYTRYSAWTDELYSACIASNPANHFMSTFGDPGNPPFYFILLRLWFQLFGWTEQSGRLLSVLIGTIAIITLYVFVKKFTNRKCAFFASLYMAVNPYFIGYSQEMRCYILLVLLATVTAHRFLIIIQEQKLSLKNIIWYIIPSILLVNTHYYGSLFVFATFLFYIFFSVKSENITWKKILIFFSSNLIIALSLLPFFLHTALNKALLNSDFNTWIEKPNFRFISLAVFTVFLIILYIFLRGTIIKKVFTNKNYYFPDYSVFIISLVYLIAFRISFFRPILTERYLIILSPFTISILTMFIFYMLTTLIKYSKIFGNLFFAILFINISIYSPRGGGSDVFYESLSFISNDAQANSTVTSKEILMREILMYDNYAKFYNYRGLPRYNSNSEYDVLYINPLHRSQESIFERIDELDINRNRVLQIRVNRRKSVFKIYSD